MSGFFGANALRRFICAILLLVASWQARHWFDHQTGINKLHHPVEVTLWWALLFACLAVVAYATRHHGSWNIWAGLVIGVTVVGWAHHLSNQHVTANDYIECGAGAFIALLLLVGTLYVTSNEKSEEESEGPKIPLFTRVRATAAERLAGTRS